MSSGTSINKYVVLLIALVAIVIGGGLVFYGVSIWRLDPELELRIVATVAGITGAYVGIQGLRIIRFWMKVETDSMTFPRSTSDHGGVNTTISTEQIGKVYEALRDTGTSGSFAVFIPPTVGRLKKDLNIQFSIEAGEIGFDWVLLAPANMKDKAKFEQFAADMGVATRFCEKNGVTYLRTNDQRAVELCQQVLLTMYSVPPSTRLELIGEGFQWPPKT